MNIKFIYNRDVDEVGAKETPSGKAMTEDPAGGFPRRLRRCPRKASLCRAHQHTILKVKMIILSNRETYSFFITAKFSYLSAKSLFYRRNAKYIGEIYNLSAKRNFSPDNQLLSYIFVHTPWTVLFTNTRPRAKIN